MKNIKKSNIFQLFLIIILIIIGTISLSEVQGTNNYIEQKKAEKEELKRPANLELIVIEDQTCNNCISLQTLIDSIKKKNVKITKENTWELSQAEAQDLIKNYNIKKIPALLIKGELNKTDELKKLWSAIGKIQNETFILTSLNPPYLDLNSNMVVGLVSITYLTDKSCTECYDALNHKTILERNFGVKLVEEKTIDISDKEGKEIIKNYNITKVPTILVNDQIAFYPRFSSAWKKVGSIEKDGIYIFRQVEQMGAYYDLEKKELVKPQTQTNTNQSGS